MAFELLLHVIGTGGPVFFLIVRRLPGKSDSGGVHAALVSKELDSFDRTVVSFHRFHGASTVGALKGWYRRCREHIFPIFRAPAVRTARAFYHGCDTLDFER